MVKIYDTKAKGYGIERRRCPFCENLQEVISIQGAPTIFFRCEECNSGVFLQDIIETMLPSLAVTLDTT